MGAAPSNTLFSVINKANEFPMLSVNSLKTSNPPSPLLDYYYGANLPFPNLKFEVGVKLLAGIEVLGIFPILPEVLTVALVRNSPFR